MNFDHLRQIVNDADRNRRARYSCKVCCAAPDESGTIEHGWRCYTQSLDGGGESFADVPADPLLKALPDLLAIAEAAETYYRVCADARSDSADRGVAVDRLFAAIARSDHK